MSSLSSDKKVTAANIIKGFYLTCKVKRIFDKNGLLDVDKLPQIPFVKLTGLLKSKSLLLPVTRMLRFLNLVSGKSTLLLTRKCGSPSRVFMCSFLVVSHPEAVFNHYNEKLAALSRELLFTLSKSIICEDYSGVWKKYLQAFYAWKQADKNVSKAIFQMRRLLFTKFLQKMIASMIRTFDRIHNSKLSKMFTDKSRRDFQMSWIVHANQELRRLYKAILKMGG